MKRWFQFTSLRQSLALWFCLAAMLPLSTGTVFIYFQYRASARAEALEKLAAIRDLKVELIRSWLQERIANVEVLVSNRELRDLESVLDGRLTGLAAAPVLERARELLVNRLEAYSDYDELYIVDALTGRVVLSTDSQREGEDKSKEPFFQQPRDEGILYIQDIYYSSTVDKPVMALSAPIYGLSEPGRIFGVLVLRVDLENSLYRLLLDRTGIGASGETLIVNRRGLAVSELRWQAQAPLQKRITAEPALQGTAGHTGVIESRDYRGVPVLAAYTHIAETGWGFVAKQDQDELYAAQRSLLVFTLILVAGFVALLYGVAQLLARGLTRPVEEMAGMARGLREGRFDLRLSSDRRDELGLLASVIDEMGVSLEEQLWLQRARGETAETLVQASDLGSFARNLTEGLVERSGSCLGAFFLLNEESSLFEPLASLGAGAAALKPFPASVSAGDLGRAVAESRTVHLKGMPQDTVFTFRTLAGEALPRELLAVPYTVSGRVRACLCLAGLAPYPPRVLKLLEGIQLVVQTALSGMLAASRVKDLSRELEERNRELKLQANELQEQNVELQYQTRRIEEADRLKTAFLSNMSHELRTPLNSVLALTRVLIARAAGRLSEEEAGYLEVIRRNGQRLLSLINDILDLSRIESGQIELSIRPLSPRALIEAVLESLAPVAEAKGILIRTELPADLGSIQSDEARMHQILQNVIGNAVKFTDEGEVTVSASRGRRRLQIVVADTGIGIPASELPRIFDEFRQADGSAARRHEGTGLGLAIAQKSARLLGGGITVESEPGQGSTFRITLPLPPGTQAEALPQAGAQPAQLAAGARILLVEDNEQAVVQVRGILEERGYVVEVARSGQEALLLAANRSPDGVILDLMMPEMDGFEVLERLRSREESAHLPVLILTAKDLTPAELRRLRSNHIQQLVQKGDVDSEDLLERVRGMLQPSAPAAERRKTTRSKVRRPEAGSPPPGGARQGEVSPAEKPRLLLVEDNPDNVTAVRAVLQDEYHLLVAGDAATALALAREELPDLVLLDVALPGMDGLKVMGELRGTDRTRGIPVIALTAAAMKGDRERFLAAGCDGYLSKPFDPLELKAAVRGLLGSGRSSIGGRP